MQKGFAPILVLIILTTLVLVGGGIVYLNQTNNTGIKPQVMPSPTTTPIKDEIAGWKIYFNQKYGFSFQYPQDALLEKEDDSNLQLKWDKDFKFNPCSVTTLLAVDVGDSKEDQRFGNRNVFGEDIRTKNILIDGVPALETTEDLGGAYGRYQIGFKKDKYYYVFEGIPCFDEPSRKIISTFKFLDQNDETKDWKTYINNKLGISLNYPNDSEISVGGTYSVDGVFVNDPNSVSLLVNGGQITFYTEFTDKTDVGSFRSELTPYDGKDGFDYEGNKIQELEIGGNKAIMGATSGPRGSDTAIVVNKGKVYTIIFEPSVDQTGELILKSLSFL